MKTYLVFAIVGCALTLAVSYAGPSSEVAPAPHGQPAESVVKVPAIKTPGDSHSVPSGQTKSPLPNERRPGLGTSIGGPAAPGKTTPSIIGAVNPAKSTAAVNGTGMNHKH